VTFSCPVQSLESTNRLIGIVPKLIIIIIMMRLRDKLLVILCEEYDEDLMT